MRNSGRRALREDGPLILDGTRLARERSAGLAQRAAGVTRERGRQPRLALVAFADASGGAPYVARKVRACTAAGVEAVPLILPAGITTAGARKAIEVFLDDEWCDGVFLEFPFPVGIDGDAVTGVIPESADVDVMTEGRIHRYISDGEGPPPLTVSAVLELLDGYGVDVADLEGILVAETSPFTLMLGEALSRRGVRMRAILPPDSSDLDGRIAEARLVVAAAAKPGIVRSGTLAQGTIAMDAGYFNAGGNGDIAVSDGIAHLAAIAPVPGGVGPMTVSVLVERVIEFAERSAASVPPAADHSATFPKPFAQPSRLQG